jgi:DNA-binding transcriptional ArsR family regulator
VDRDDGSEATPAGTPQLDLLKALGDNTRYAIYLELARSARPLATADISESLGLHPNTVRPHLERMRDVGLLDVEVGGRGDVGRPQHRYSLAAHAPSLGFEPPTMPVLARMVLAMASRLQASGDDAEAVGRIEGSGRAEPYEQAPSTLEALVSDLDRLGFDPIVTDSPDDPMLRSSRSPTARSPSWPRSTPSWSAACIAAWSPGSSPGWATARSTSSAH